MAITDPGDVAYQPNVLNSTQVVGDIIMGTPRGGGVAITRDRKNAAPASEIWTKYHDRLRFTAIVLTIS